MPLWGGALGMPGKLGPGSAVTIWHRAMLECLRSAKNPALLFI